MPPFLREPDFWVIVVSIALGIATYFAIPRLHTKPRQQAWFWSIVLTTLSLVLGMLLTGRFETHKKLGQISFLFDEVVGEETLEQFRSLVTLYHKNFSHSDPVISDWAREVLNSLQSDMASGIISMPWDAAKDKSVIAWKAAKSTVVATNVGSTKFFFADPLYVSANREARNNGVIVIRFYLFSAEKRIELKDSARPERCTFEEYVQEVRELHEHLGTLVSAIIDLDRATVKEDRDLLLIDNRLAAELELSRNWEPMRTWITADEIRLRDVRRYLGALRRQEMRLLYLKEENRVRDLYSKWPGFERAANREYEEDRPLALKIFDEISEEIGRKR